MGDIKSTKGAIRKDGPVDLKKIVKNTPRAKNTRAHIQKNIDSQTIKNMESEIKTLLENQYKSTKSSLLLEPYKISTLP